MKNLLISPRVSSLLGQHVLCQGLAGRFTGTARIPAKDHDYIVVTPDGATVSDVIHVSDVISIIA